MNTSRRKMTMSLIIAIRIALRYNMLMTMMTTDNDADAIMTKIELDKLTR